MVATHNASPLLVAFPSLLAPLLRSSRAQAEDNIYKSIAKSGQPASSAALFSYSLTSDGQTLTPLLCPTV